MLSKQLLAGAEAWNQGLWELAQRTPLVHRTDYISLFCLCTQIWQNMHRLGLLRLAQHPGLGVPLLELWYQAVPPQQDQCL